MKKIVVLLLLFGTAWCLKAQDRTEIKMYKTFGGARFELDTLVLSLRQVLQLLKVEPLAYEKFKRAKLNSDVGSVMGFPAAILIGIPIGTAIGGGNPEWGMAMAGGILLVGAFSLNSIFRSHAFEAIELYNGKTARIKPEFQFYGTGARLVMRF